MSWYNNKKRSKSYQPTIELRRKIEDCIFYLGNNKQARDFNTNVKFITHYIKKTYIYGNNIAETL